MSHSPRVIGRIVELIKLAGINNNAQIEEMTDHYLSEIEYSIENGNTEQKAIRETYQKIALTDLKPVNQNRDHKKWFIAILALIAFIILAITQYNQHTKKTVSTVDLVTYEAPKGWPISNGIDQITSSFGLKTNPISNELRFHKGIDIKAPTGTLIQSTGDGWISEIGYKPNTGNYILIKHNDLYSTRYLHLSKIEVTNNQKIKKGEIIGLVGNSGISLTPHLHYEVIKNKLAVDPMDVISP